MRDFVLDNIPGKTAPGQNHIKPPKNFPTSCHSGLSEYSRNNAIVKVFSITLQVYHTRGYIHVSSSHAALPANISTTTYIAIRVNRAVRCCRVV
jgi:hypothetical protein